MPAELVGRAAELAALVACCRQAESAFAPAVAIVTGPPGAGKSRLLAEMGARVAAPRRVRVGGYEPDSAIPLAAARELLRSLSARTEGALVERLLFGSRTAAGDTLQLFEAAARAMTARPLLHVVVDDLQWVDETSLALLHYAVRAAEATASPLVVVAAGRPTVPADRFASALAGVVTDPERLLRVDLAPLDQRAGSELARGLAPRLDERAAQDVWRRAGGSPFWIEVLALARSGRGADGALERRLRAASGDAGRLLAVLAVAGRPVDPATLAGALDRPPARCDRAVADLLALGLAADDGAGPAVVHDIVRERVLQRLPSEAAREVHRRLAEELARRATDDGSLLEALEHGRRGGVPDVGTALRLARSSRRRLLGPAGLALLRAVAADADPATADGAALRRAVAGLAAELGQHELALDAWSAVARSATSPEGMAEAMLAASECALHLGRAVEAERLLGQAARVAPADDATAIELDARAATVHLWLRHREPAGREAARRAVRRARELAARRGGPAALGPGERRAWLRAHLAGAEAAILADRPAEVLQLTDELAEVAAADDPRVRLRALVEGGIALRWLGRNADAEARLRLTWAEARAEALPQSVLEVGASLAKVLHSRGRLAEAAEVLAECEALGQRLAEFCPARAFTPVVAALVAASVGDWRTAVGRLRAVAATEVDPHYRAHARLEAALLSARYDPRHAPHVRGDVEHALADAAESGCRRCGFEVTARSAEALARIGDLGSAHRLVDGWAPDPRDGNRALQWWGGQARAAVATAEGALDAAAAMWAGTVAAAERSGMVLEALWARQDLAAVVAATDRGRGAELWRRTGEEAGLLGARTEQQVAERALRALGVRTWRRGAAAGPPGLTDREREIAERIAAGLNNAEIAAALFLSRKTVERHVSNVLARCGARNRAELAAAWSSRAHAASGPEGVPR
ncbi:AAA family ATPase [Geodermatophilus sp. YIM 151500]|uniref:AAA family ATPase n=1 Tax=Geodermatophilus sp. YIM 151500 TaxID=2984531 RepID=UPI0021E4375C|nr:LuxR family transcriptional regulator [Geodermatophilus sp. YIM 151500]MCV2490790.1 AAA family ATPase [Geodermatophilus sp. YIM 151500]